MGCSDPCRQSQIARRRIYQVSGIRNMLSIILSRASLATLSSRASTARVISSAPTKVFFSTTTTTSSNIRPGYAQIKEKQKYFNIDNGKRVRERGGAKDDIMYNLTLLIILVGAVEWVRVVYALAFPTKG